MKLFNSYTNAVEEFKPIEENKVKMYVCGPTVYDYAHLGHARCYITWDVLYRYLKFKGYDVTYCRNVTDVDDKILKKADKKDKNGAVLSRSDLQALKKDPALQKKLGVTVRADESKGVYTVTSNGSTLYFDFD